MTVREWGLRTEAGILAFSRVPIPTTVTATTTPVVRVRNNGRPVQLSQIINYKPWRSPLRDKSTSPFRIGKNIFLVFYAFKLHVQIKNAKNIRGYMWNPVKSVKRFKTLLAIFYFSVAVYTPGSIIWQLAACHIFWHVNEALYNLNNMLCEDFYIFQTRIRTNFLF